MLGQCGCDRQDIQGALHPEHPANDKATEALDIKMVPRVRGGRGGAGGRGRRGARGYRRARQPLGRRDASRRPGAFPPRCSLCDPPCLRGGPYPRRSAPQAGSGPLHVPLPFTAAVVRAAAALLGDDPMGPEMNDPKELRG